LGSRRPVEPRRKNCCKNIVDGPEDRTDYADLAHDVYALVQAKHYFNGRLLSHCAPRTEDCGPRVSRPTPYGPCCRSRDRRMPLPTAAPAALGLNVRWGCPFRSHEAGPGAINICERIAGLPLFAAWFGSIRRRLSSKLLQSCK